jgi:formylglycine-generating enzyme required for sulfatase activity
MKFVPVPGTKVLFCIHETRWQDYAAFAAVTPDLDRRWETREGHSVPSLKREDEPVTNMNWADAAAFCVWLSKKEDRSYRLPTDREWSYAVGIGEREDWREGTTPEMRHAKLAGEYPWGRQWPPPNGAGNFADSTLKAAEASWATIDNCSDGFPSISPVGSFPANQFGIHDLAGNVWEWCADLYSPNKPVHFLRGGAWSDSSPNELLASYRRRLHDNHRGPWGSHGFRCVVELP